MEKLRISAREQSGVLVVSVVGTLDWASYLRMQDVLLDHASRELVGVVVEIDGLVVRSPVLLVVFDIVWLSVARWPGVPMTLVVDDPDVTSLLDSKELPRHMPRFRTTAEALAAVRKLRHGDQVDAPLPTCRCQPYVAEEITERACRQWGVASLLEIAPQVAVEMVSHTEGGTGVSLLLRRRASELSIAIRTSARIATAERLTLRHNIASIAVCDFRMGETRVGSDRMVIWTVLDIPQAHPTLTSSN